ncbi:MAG: HD domain-containing protein [Clostridia bacterium]|nr:HD domain-containing protein [Clostridia bacterium]
MDTRKLLEVLCVAERLKDMTRHCYTKNGRRESVAEHSWMTTLMAFFIKDEFPEVDMDRVIKMCLIHDLGEAFTGDIPAFDKTEDNEKTEERLLYAWVDTLPEHYRTEMLALYEEMAKRETVEAKVYKALDGLEALVQHNISDLSTWIPREYTLNLTYADDKVAFSAYLNELREEIRKDTLKKLEQSSIPGSDASCEHAES